jgi:putative SOS response-associated peptidase YedK
VKSRAQLIGRRRDDCKAAYSFARRRPPGLPQACHAYQPPVGQRNRVRLPRLSSDVSEIKLVFGVPPERPAPNFAPSWNVAPTDPLPIVHFYAKAGERSLDVMRWGLIPFWAKDIKIGFSTINAKAEGIETKPAFREAFQRRRCLVPLDSFYEWKKIGTGKAATHA